MRKICTALALVVSLAAAAGCTQSTTVLGTANNGGNGGNGGINIGAPGKATATVVYDSHSYSLTGGTCIDVGTILGTQITVGDYANGEAGTGDYLSMIVKGDTVSTVGGRAGGIPWALATGKQHGSISAGGTGTFDGTDFASGKEVSGTFACS